MDRKNKKRDRDEDEDEQLQAGLDSAAQQILKDLKSAKFTEFVLGVIYQAKTLAPVKPIGYERRDLAFFEKKLRNISFRAPARSDLEGNLRVVKREQRDVQIRDATLDVATWDARIVYFLRLAGSSVQIKNEEGETVLFILARLGFVESLRYLVDEAGLNPMARNHWGFTAAQTMLLHHNHNVDPWIPRGTMEFLVEAGDHLLGDELMRRNLDALESWNQKEARIKTQINLASRTKINKFGWMEHKIRASDKGKFPFQSDTIVNAVFEAPVGFECGQGPKHNRFPVQLRLDTAEIVKIRSLEGQDNKYKEWQINATLTDDLECEKPQKKASDPISTILLAKGTQFRFYEAVPRLPNEFLYQCHLAEPTEDEDGNPQLEDSSRNKAGMFELDLGEIFDKTSLQYRNLKDDQVLDLVLPRLLKSSVSSAVSLDPTESKKFPSPLAILHVLLNYQESYAWCRLPKRLVLPKHITETYQAAVKASQDKSNEEMIRECLSLFYLTSWSQVDDLLEGFYLHFRSIHDRILLELTRSSVIDNGRSLQLRLIVHDATHTRVLTIESVPTKWSMTMDRGLLATILKSYLLKHTEDEDAKFLIKVRNWVAMLATREDGMGAHVPAVLLTFWMSRGSSEKFQEVRSALQTMLVSILLRADKAEAQAIEKEMHDLDLRWLLLSNEVFAMYMPLVRERHGSGLLFYHTEQIPKTLLDFGINLKQASMIVASETVTVLQVKKFLEWLWKRPRSDAVYAEEGVPVIHDVITHSANTIRDSKKLELHGIPVPSFFPPFLQTAIAKKMHPQGINLKTMWKHFFGEHPKEAIFTNLIARAGVFLIPRDDREIKSFSEYSRVVRATLVAINRFHGRSDDFAVPSVYKAVPFFETHVERILDKFKLAQRALKEEEEEKEQQVQQQQEEAARQQEQQQAQADEQAMQQNINAQMAAAEQIGEDEIAQLGVERQPEEEEEDDTGFGRDAAREALEERRLREEELGQDSDIESEPEPREEEEEDPEDDPHAIARRRRQREREAEDEEEAEEEEEEDEAMSGPEDYVA